MDTATSNKSSADERGPLRTFADSIKALSGFSGSTKRWNDSAVSASKAAVGTFLLSMETLTVSQIELAWADAMYAAVESYARTSSPESALLAQNFPGLILWRLDVTWDRGSWKKGSERIKNLIDAMTGSQAVSRLTRNGLSVNSAYGPAATRSSLFDWLTDFEESAETAFSYTPEELMASPSVPDTAALLTKLTATKYDKFYDFPLVQEGLRLVAAATGWIIPFCEAYACTKDQSYKPLTRALFTIAFVDQHFWSATSKRPAELAKRFAADADSMDEDAMMSPAEANTTKRTAYESRLSAALSYGDPFVREIEPGISSARIRSDPSVFAEDGPLDLDVLGIHVPGVLRLISSSGGDRRYEGRRADNVRVLLADLAGSTLASAQRAQSVRQILQRLIRSGFMPHACRAYDAALKSEFTRNRYSSANGEEEEYCFDEAQQAVGCVAALGNAVFGLAAAYGPGLDYLDSYIYATGPAEFEWSDYYAAIGWPEGALSNALGRSMPPKAFPNYVRAAKMALEAEIESSERLAASSMGSAMMRGNSARESLMLWFYRRAEESWGIVYPMAEKKSKHQESGASASDRQPGAISVSREAEMLSAAASARYPKPAPEKAELRSPQFGKYVVASAGVDALATVASGSFTAPHIAASIEVLTWARDYGGPEVGSFEDHKTKINSVIYALLPFSGDDPQTPTHSDAANVESLLGELYATVTTAIQALPETARPKTPEKPSAANSAFLLSMYVTATRLSLDDLVQRTERVSDTLSTLAWSVADCAGTLKTFFESDFVLTKDCCGAVMVSIDSGQIGTWSTRDLVSAVADVYGDCADAVAEARVASVSLGSIKAEAEKGKASCELLASKAAIEFPNSPGGGAAAAIYTSLADDFDALIRLQDQLEMQIRKLTASAVPPGLGSIARFLDAAGKLNSVAAAADNPQSLFSTAMESAVHAWKESERLYEEMHTATGLVTDSITEEDETSNADAIATVKDMMDDYVQRDPRQVSPDAIELSSKYNVATVSDLDARPLVNGAVSQDPRIVAPDELILKDRVTASYLIGLADSILNPSGQGVISGHAIIVK